MREWLKGIDSSFSCYFAIIEDNYDTVDQICRLYAVDSKNPDPALKGKHVDPVFFGDNRISDPEHRRQFKKWFAKSMDQSFVDDEAPALASAAVPPHSVAPVVAIASPSAGSVPASGWHAPEAVVADVQKTDQPGQEVAAGWASSRAWSGDAWTGSSWWGSQAGNENDEKATNDASETTWSKSAWGASDYSSWK